MEQIGMHIKAPSLIAEQHIVSPLLQVLDHVVPQDTQRPQQNIKQSKSLTQSLEELFPEQQHQEKNIQTAKKVLGSLADSFTSEQLKDMTTEMLYLTDSWLDDFEREIFDGITLKELLHEKGGL